MTADSIYNLVADENLEELRSEVPARDIELRSKNISTK